MSDDDLRVGVIGYGLRNRLAENAHRPGEGSAIVAVCDPRAERLSRARERYGDGPLYPETPDISVTIGDSEGGHGGADPSIVAEFLGYVRSGGTTVTDPIAACEAVATGYAATQSLRSGGVAIDIPTPA